MLISGGGFMWQSHSIFKGIKEKFDVSIIIPNDTLMVIQQLNLGELLEKDKIHQLTPLTTITNTKKLVLAKRFTSILIGGFKIIKKENPDVIICNASSIAIPLFIVGKLLRKKTIFIESITRIDKASTTGLILDKLHLCDRLYVQWPEIQNQYRNATYKGTVI